MYIRGLRGWIPLNGRPGLRLMVRRMSKSRGRVAAIGCAPALSVTYSAATAAVPACGAVCRVAHKIWHTFLYALKIHQMLTILDVFHSQTQEKICNNIIIKVPPHLRCVATLPCEMSVS